MGERTIEQVEQQAVRARQLGRPEQDLVAELYAMHADMCENHAKRMRSHPKKAQRKTEKWPRGRGVP